MITICYTIASLSNYHYNGFCGVLTSDNMHLGKDKWSLRHVKKIKILKIKNVNVEYISYGQKYTETHCAETHKGFCKLLGKKFKGRI